MQAIGKATKWSVPFLVIAAMLIAAVPAAATNATTNNDGGYQWEWWSSDASCEWLVGWVDGQLTYDGEPVDGVPVYFTYQDEEYGPYYTHDSGQMWTYWAYTPGAGEVSVFISAEGWGEIEVTFGGPQECPGNPTPSMNVACRDVTFSAPGADWVGGYIETEGDYQEAWEIEGDTFSFGDLIPGATYYYEWYWWSEEGGGGIQHGYFDVPESCPTVEYFPCIEVEYGDNLYDLSIKMFGNIFGFYNGSQLICESAVGDWGQNCHFPVADEVLYRGSWVCPSYTPSTGAGFLGH